jgi:hypothetical protein
MTLKTSLVFVIACAAVLLAVPAAWGDNWGADTKDQAVSQVRPDDRAGPLGIGAVTARPDDRLGIRGVAPARAAVVHAQSTGFDWGDAAIGGAFVLTLALLGMGATLISLRRRSSPKPA